MGFGNIISPKTKSFQTILVPSGTSPTADSPTDSISYTSLDNSITIVGTDDPESVDFSVNEAAPPNTVIGSVPCESALQIGQWARMNTSNIAIRALADSLTNSLVIGLCVAKETATLCTIRYLGESAELFTGLDVEKEYFLSATTLGEMTSTPPSGSGEIVLKLGQPRTDKKFLVLKSTRIQLA